MPPLLRSLITYPFLALLQAQDIAPPPVRPPVPSPKGQDSRDDDARPAKRQRVETTWSDNTVDADLKPDISKLHDGDGDEDELSLLKVCLRHLFTRIFRLDAHTTTSLL